MTAMVVFDLEAYLDNAGVPMLEKTPITPAIWGGKNCGLIVANSALIEPVEQSKWYNKTIYGSGAIVKTKDIFPLCFVESPDGCIWTDPDDFNRKVFALHPGHQLTIIEEGAMKVGKITPETMHYQGQMSAGKPELAYSDGPTVLPYGTQAMYELRYLKCLALFDKNSKLADLQGSGDTPRPILGSVVFFLLFNRTSGKKYADEILFELLYDSGNSGKPFEVIDYRDFLTIA